MSPVSLKPSVLKDKLAGRSWPSYLFKGRVRTSTAALVALFIALFWVQQAFQPEPKPAPAPVVVPPGFVPDPDYTWVPRTQVEVPRTTTRRPQTTTTTTTTPTTTTTTTTSPTSPTSPTSTSPPLPTTTVIDPDGPGLLPPRTVTETPTPTPGLPPLPGLPLPLP